MNVTQAKDIIFKRIVSEVFLGHNAIGVYTALSMHSSALNDSTFCQTFGIIQRHAFDAFILSLCKLYEKPNKKYPNHSIPTTLEILRENVSDLADKIKNYTYLEQFIQTHIDYRFSVQCIDDIKRIPELILDHFLNQCPKTPPRDGYDLDNILDALKVLRDKRVAHHEVTDLASMRKTNLDDALRLLEFAQSYINFVGYGFFGFSRKDKVKKEKFDPSKSVVWPELIRITEILNKTTDKSVSKQGPYAIRRN